MSNERTSISKKYNNITSFKSNPHILANKGFNASSVNDIKTDIQNTQTQLKQQSDINSQEISDSILNQKISQMNYNKRTNSPYNGKFITISNGTNYYVTNMGVARKVTGNDSNINYEVVNKTIDELGLKIGSDMNTEYPYGYAGQSVKVTLPEYGKSEYVGCSKNLVKNGDTNISSFTNVDDAINNGTMSYSDCEDIAQKTEKKYFSLNTKGKGGDTGECWTSNSEQLENPGNSTDCTETSSNGFKISKAASCVGEWLTGNDCKDNVEWNYQDYYYGCRSSKNFTDQIADIPLNPINFSENYLSSMAGDILSSENYDPPKLIGTCMENEILKTIPAGLKLGPKYDYLGCYKDNSNRAMEIRTAGVPNGKPATDSCSKQCEGYQYFGLQWYGQCFCSNGDGYKRYGKQTSCNTFDWTKPYNGEQFGGWTNHVFDNVNINEKPSNCPDGWSLYGDGSACKNGSSRCALWGNASLSRCTDFKSDDSDSEKPATSIEDARDKTIKAGGVAFSLNLKTSPTQLIIYKTCDHLDTTKYPDFIHYRIKDEPSKNYNSGTKSSKSRPSLEHKRWTEISALQTTSSGYHGSSTNQDAKKMNDELLQKGFNKTPWSPSALKKSSYNKEFLGVKLNSQYFVTSISLTGNVNTCQIYYSVSPNYTPNGNETSIGDLLASNNVIKSGSSDYNASSVINLATPIITNSIFIVPTTWNGVEPSIQIQNMSGIKVDGDKIGNIVKKIGSYNYDDAVSKLNLKQVGSESISLEQAFTYAIYNNKYIVGVVTDSNTQEKNKKVKYFVSSMNSPADEKNYIESNISTIQTATPEKLLNEFSVGTNNNNSIVLYKMTSGNDDQWNITNKINDSLNNCNKVNASNKLLQNRKDIKKPPPKWSYIDNINGNVISGDKRLEQLSENNYKWCGKEQNCENVSSTVYKTVVSEKGEVGKSGYVDEDGVLHEYPSNMVDGNVVINKPDGIRGTDTHPMNFINTADWKKFKTGGMVSSNNKYGIVKQTSDTTNRLNQTVSTQKTAMKTVDQIGERLDKTDKNLSYNQGIQKKYINYVSDTTKNINEVGDALREAYTNMIPFNKSDDSINALLDDTRSVSVTSNYEMTFYSILAASLLVGTIFTMNKMKK